MLFGDMLVLCVGVRVILLVMVLVLFDLFVVVEGLLVGGGGVGVGNDLGGVGGVGMVVMGGMVGVVGMVVFELVVFGLIGVGCGLLFFLVYVV